MKTSTLLRASTLAAALCAALSAHAVTFSDDFSASQATSTNNGAGQTFNGQTSSPFGTATRYLTTYVATNTAVGDARARTAIQNGVLTFSSDREVSGLGFVSYLFAGPTDFTGTTGFAFDVLANDVAGQVGVTVFDQNGPHQTFYSLPAGVNHSFIPPNQFAGADAAHVTRLDFAFGGTQGEDLTIDSIQAVPEPSAFAALGLGAVGLLRRRKRA